MDYVLFQRGNFICIEGEELKEPLDARTLRRLGGVCREQGLRITEEDIKTLEESRMPFEGKIIRDYPFSDPDGAKKEFMRGYSQTYRETNPGRYDKPTKKKTRKRKR